MLAGLFVLQAYTLVREVLYCLTWLQYDRHLDQLLLCAVYGVCKVGHSTRMQCTVALLTRQAAHCCTPTSSWPP